MTFDEWLNTKSPEWIFSRLPRDFLLDVWYAATLAERQRCAKVADDYAKAVNQSRYESTFVESTARELAGLIRKGP